ncbi:hypothetical protein Droror1_Dr00022451 [Drosera rotundifolia]
MGKSEQERLNRALASHLDSIHETLKALEQTPSNSLEKVSWDEVVKVSEQLSKQATTVGMLWSGEKPGLKALKESMVSYFNVLQVLLLLAYGSTVGAGPTLSSNVHTAVKQVVDSSFMLWRESVSSYGSSSLQKLQIPQVVGTVWDACSAMRKTPSTNITAIGRAITQVAISVKDVLREMKELKLYSSDSADVADGSSSKPSKQSDDGDDDSSLEDIGNDLSPEEMKIAQLVTRVVSDLLVVIKELIRSITGLLKQANISDDGSCVESLEKLLKLCRGAGVEVDELGASLYPPQELPVILAASDKISDMIKEMELELDTIKGSTTAFSQACLTLKWALDELKSQVSIESVHDETQSSRSVELIQKMQDLTVAN